MKAVLSELGEIVVGALWWGGGRVWGVVMGAMLLLAPLILANLLAELLDSVTATVALAGGVVGAYVLGLPPWDGEDRHALLLVIGGSAVSVVVWDLVRGSADAGTLVVAVSLTVLGWPIRRIVSAAWTRRLSS